MDSVPKQLISVVVPVLNEEKNIERCYAALLPIFKALSSRYDCELIFTDNHSGDRTFELAADLAAQDRRVRVFRFSRNFGFQQSILTGYQKARGDAVVQIDCDLQDPPALILEFVKKWEEGYQVVYGIRRRRKEGFLITACRSLFYAVVDALSEYPLPKQAGDFRLIGRPIVDQLVLLEEPDLYIRGVIAGLGFNQTGIPYDREKRKQGESKFNFRKLAALGVDGILSTSIIPLRVATFIGLAVSAAAMLGAAYFFASALIFGRRSWPSGWATVTIGLLFSLGLNSLFMGILGEYLGRTYKQTKKRPITIIEQAIDSASDQLVSSVQGQTPHDTRIT
jgi:glycosyltransferase involved in cell wall biosynthesis